MLSIAIIVPVYNGGKAFLDCLRRLQDLHPGAQEIIVVSDGDGDGSWQCVKSYGYSLIRLPENRGVATARNAGARAAQSDILFFIDADVLVHTDVIERVQYAFRSFPDAAALIGSYDDQPTEKNFLSQYKNLLHHFTHQQGQSQATTFWGACGAIRRQAFFAVGGFDERFPGCSIEDIELGYRLIRKGHSIRLIKDLQVTHMKRWTIKSLLRADFLLRAVPWTELILRDQMFVNDLNINREGRLSVVCSSIVLLSLLTGSFVPPMRWAMVTSAGIFLVINAPVYRFFWTKRGPVFTAMVIPWHWLYYVYSGIAFILGSLRFRVGRAGIPMPRMEPEPHFA